MLGLLLIYWIGKTYYKLAEKYNRSKWGFAVLGPVVYYAGSIIGVLAIMLIYYTSGYANEFDAINERLLDFMGVPFGALACWGLFQLLKKRWAQNTLPTTNAELLDDLENL